MKTLQFLVAGALLPATLWAAKSQSILAYQNYSRGVELVARKKWDEALEKFQSAIDLNPAYVASYIEYARAAAMHGQRRNALEKLSSALEFTRGREERERVIKERDNLSDIFYTNDTFQLYQNGLNFLKLDRPGSALEAFEKALKTEPDNVSILSAYARTLRQQDRAKEAQEVLERAILLNDGKREVRTDLAELLVPQKPERALTLMKPLVAGTNLSDERVAWIQAQALSAAKKNRDAIEFLRNAHEKQPGWTYAPLYLGKLYALEADGGWNARKYLMTFLRRTESVASAATAGELDPESQQIKAARAEAEAILARVNQALQ